MNEDIFHSYLIYTLKKEASEDSTLSSHILVEKVRKSRSGTLSRIKEEIDARLLELLKEINIKEVMQSGKLDEVAENISSKIDENLKDKLREEFQALEENLNKTGKSEANPNLILSEVFGGRGELEGKEGEKIPIGASYIPILVPATKDLLKNGLNLSTFERIKSTVRTGNSNKIIDFLHLVNQFNFSLEFNDEEKTIVEGFLLMILYASQERLGDFVNEPYFVKFLNKFAKRFANSYSQEIRTKPLSKYPHLFLLASFDKNLCNEMIEQGCLEALSEQIIPRNKIEDKDSVKGQQENFKVFLMLFTQLISKCQRAVDRIVQLQLIDQVIEQNKELLDISAISLISSILNQCQKIKVGQKQILSRNLLIQMSETIFKAIEEDNEVNLLAEKIRSKPSSFHSLADSPLQLLDQFISFYSKDLLKDCKDQYRNHYFVSLVALKFFSKIELISKESEFVERLFKNILNIFSLFFYQKKIVKLSLKIFKKMIGTIPNKDFIDSFLTQEILHSIFSIFNQNLLDKKAINILISLQQVLQAIIENLLLNQENLSMLKTKLVLDFLCQIRETILEFYIDLKKKYLGKGIEKYISKIKKEFKKTMFDSLDLCLSTNAMILQKISHTHNISRIITLYINEKPKANNVHLNLESDNRNEIKADFRHANNILYILSKIDKREESVKSVFNFNFALSKKIDQMISSIEKNKVIVHFEIIKEIFENIIMSTYFLKVNSEHFAKEDSKMMLKKYFEMIARMLNTIKTFVDLSSNYEIYLIIEQFNLFWYLMFNFKLSFYDRFSFIFIDNLKKINKDPMEDQYLFESDHFHTNMIINFFNEFIDIRTKCIYINFVILKQLDIIYNTFNLNDMNMNLIGNIFEKAFSADYSNDLFRINPKYVLNISIKTLSRDGIKESFIKFVFKNHLFFNNYVISILRELLDKNPDISFVPQTDQFLFEMFCCRLKKKPLPSGQEYLKTLFTVAQKSIKQKNLFKDVVVTMAEHLEKSDEQSKIFIEHLMLKTNLFEKVLKLYKKEKMNLTKVLESLLLIADKFQLLKNITLPDRLIETLFDESGFEEFHATYLYIFEYFYKKKIDQKYKDKLDSFLKANVDFLYSKVFFNKNFDYEKDLKKIYFSTKMIRSAYRLLFIRVISDLELSKIMIQILHENNKLEIVDVNNLYQLFSIEHNGSESKIRHYEKLLLVILFEMIQETKMGEKFFKDYQLVLKLLGYSYFAVDKQTFEFLKPTFFDIIKSGLDSPNRKPIFDCLFSDFYLFLSYEHSFEVDPELHQFVIQIVFSKISIDKFINSELQGMRKIKLDSTGINHLIRQLLIVHYISGLPETEIGVESRLKMIESIVNLMRENFGQINSLPKLEKLIISLCFKLGSEKTKSMIAAKTFLEIFNSKVTFRLNAETDRFTYIRLFNLYFEKSQKTKILEFHPETFEVTLSSSFQQSSGKSLESLRFETYELNQSLRQINYVGIDEVSEISIYDFLAELNEVNSSKVYAIEMIEEFYSLKLEQIVNSIAHFISEKEVNIELIYKRLGFLSYYIARESFKTERMVKPFFEKITGLIEVISAQFENFSHLSVLEFTEKMKNEHIFNLIKSEIDILQQIYELASEKNETRVKKTILKAIVYIIPIPEKSEHFENNIVYLIDRILFFFIIVIKFKYDEFRVATFDGLLDKLFVILKNNSLNGRKDIAKLSWENYTIENSPQFIIETNFNSMMEKMIYLVCVMTKSYFLLAEDLRVELWNNVDEKKLKLMGSDLSQHFVLTLKNDFSYLITKDMLHEQSVKYSEKNIQTPDERQKESQVIERQVSKPQSSLSGKQKNILYLHKTFWSLREILNERSLDYKEEQYLEFAIVGLQKHFFESLDPAVINKLEFFQLLSNLFVSKNLPISYKQEILTLIKLYIEASEEDNGIEQKNTEEFIYHYKISFKEEFQSILEMYLSVLLLILQNVQFTEDFIQKYLIEIETVVFDTERTLKTPMILYLLRIYSTALSKHQPNLDYPTLQSKIYQCIRKSNEDQRIEEKLLYAEIVGLIDDKSNFKEMMLKNIFLLLKLKHKEDTLMEIKRSLEIMQRLSRYSRFQEMLRTIGFELIFKTLMKLYGKNKEITVGLSSVFLKYTYQSNDNKFEMFETIKMLMKFISDFYKQDDRQVVILLYKCLINASLMKKNSEFMIKAGIKDVLVSCFYKDDDEFHLVFLSLLFNISHQLDEEEIKSEVLFEKETFDKVSLIFDHLLDRPKVMDNTVFFELMELMLSCVQNNRTKLFTLHFIQQLKIALSLFYDSSTIVSKLLGILNQLSVADDTVKKNMSVTFDFLYLFNIHYRHLGNDRINQQVKKTILNLLNHRKNDIKEEDLIMFGIPENILHTFSLEDSEKTNLMNLTIIRFSCRFEKPRQLIKNHALFAIRELFFNPNIEGSIEILSECFLILDELYKNFKSFEMINAQYYFDDASKLMDLCFQFEESESSLMTLLRLLKCLLKTNERSVDSITSEQKKFFSVSLEKKRNSLNREMLQELFEVCDLLNFKASFIENAIAGGNWVFLSEEDKALLLSGLPVVCLFEEQIFRNATFKFDFMDSIFTLTSLIHIDPLTKVKLGNLTVSVKRIESVDKIYKTEQLAVEDALKTFFNKQVSQEHYFTLRFWEETNQGTSNNSVVIIFENEYKCKKWNAIIKSLINNK